MNHWTVDNLAEAAQGTWLHQPATGAFTGIHTDTRTLEPGAIFVALKGNNFDGHDFIDHAIKAGAAAAIVDRDPSDDIRHSAFGILRVDSTLAALQRMAAYHRNLLADAETKVIAVTGSNGKTTTRHLIHAVLSSELRGTQSPKSFNNHIGVPLTLLAASPEDDFVVVEIGTNHPGEIDALAAIARPDAAVITNIGTAHIGMFGSRQDIAAEKGTLLKYIPDDGLAVLPGAEPLLEGGIATIAGDVQLVCIGNDVVADDIVLGSLDTPTRFDVIAEGEHFAVTLPLMGEHNVNNALCAIAVAQWFGIRNESIAHALEGVAGVPMRAQIVKRGNITFINDAYNANPDSMRRALTMLVSAAQGRKIAVLGDMFELGDQSPEAHRDLGRAIADLEHLIDHVVLIGKLSMFAAETLAKHWPAQRVTAFAQWQDDLPQKLASIWREGDVVLLKGSRGMALERLIEGAESAT
jgi:UDP-N-acetylmuramoyl-tripeptide--D-alanyl-D-alanine ligase